MKKEKIIMTRDGFNKLTVEYNRMRFEEMQECLENLQDAREKGDISENAEYEVAKQTIDDLNEKILKVGAQLMNAHIIESVIDNGTVQLLTWVKIKNMKLGKEVEYKIVPENESSLKENKISFSSPIGKALMGKAIGEKVSVNVPAGNMELEILNIRCF
jgi:transcription elongation factor GreA